MDYDLARIRGHFPILEREVHPGVKLVYLDSTATSQKPESVIAVMDEFYRRTNANIHRGVHVLAEEATAQYERARSVVAGFINAPSPNQVISRATRPKPSISWRTPGRVPTSSPVS